MSDSILVQLHPSESSDYKGVAGTFRTDISTNQDILIIGGASSVYAYTAVGYEFGGNYRYYQFIAAGNTSGSGQAATVSYSIAVRYTADAAIIYCSYASTILTRNQVGSHYYTVVYN